MDPLSRSLVMASAGASRVNSVQAPASQFITSGTDISITPGTVQAGDLILVWDFAQNSTTTIPTTVVSSGFTQVDNISSSGNPIFPQYGTRQIVSYKIALGNETTISGMTATSTKAMAMQIFRGNIPISQVQVRNLQSSVFIETSTTRTIGSSAGLVPCIVVSAYGNWTNEYRGIPALSTNIDTYESSGVIAITPSVGRDLMMNIFNTTPVNMYASNALDPNKDQLQTFTTFYLDIS